MQGVRASSRAATLKGDWRVPSDKFDPRIWGYDYTETNGWGYAFTAPQDSRGLANLYGGRDGLGKKLDTYFSTPETAAPEFAGSYGGVIHEMTEARDVRMGMYGHSNQVAHHAAYMYDAAAQPWKTQEKVREVLSRLYTGSEIGQGYHGDEDNGEQSAWYLFSSLGFYPLVMGSGEYAIGSPLFTKMTVHLEGGKDLVIKAPKNSAKNVYVQGLEGQRQEVDVDRAAAQGGREGRGPGVRHGAEAVAVGHGQGRGAGVHHEGRQGAVAARRCAHRRRGALRQLLEDGGHFGVGGAAGVRGDPGRAVHTDLGRPGKGADRLGP